MQSPAEVQKKKKKKTTTKKKTKKKKSTFSISASFRVCDSQFDSASTKKKKKKSPSRVTRTPRTRRMTIETAEWLDGKWKSVKCAAIRTQIKVAIMLTRWLI